MKLLLQLPRYIIFFLQLIKSTHPMVNHPVEYLFSISALHDDYFIIIHYRYYTNLLPFPTYSSDRN